MRDISIAHGMEIDPRFVNWICKAIRRDGRYEWTDDQLKKLGVWGLQWETVTDDEIRTHARTLARSNP